MHMQIQPSSNCNGSYTHWYQEKIWPQPAFKNKPVAPVEFYKNAVLPQYNIPPPLFLYHHFSAHIAWYLLTLRDTPVHFMILKDLLLR